MENRGGLSDFCRVRFVGASGLDGGVSCAAVTPSLTAPALGVATTTTPSVPFAASSVPLGVVAAIALLPIAVMITCYVRSRSWSSID